MLQTYDLDCQNLKKQKLDFKSQSQENEEHMNVGKTPFDINHANKIKLNNNDI